MPIFGSLSQLRGLLERMDDKTSRDTAAGSCNGHSRSKHSIYLVGTELHNDVKLLKAIQSLGFTVGGCLGAIDEVSNHMMGCRTPPVTNKFLNVSPLQGSGSNGTSSCEGVKTCKTSTTQCSLKALRRLSASRLPGLFSSSPNQGSGSGPSTTTPVLSTGHPSPVPGNNFLVPPISHPSQVVEEINALSLYVLPDFNGSFFDKLQREKLGRRLVGPTFLYNLMRTNRPDVSRSAWGHHDPRNLYDTPRRSNVIDEEIPEVRHPLFCLSMRGLTLCFSRFTDALQLTNLVCLAQYMGATVRKKFNGPRVTHLVSLSAQGDKYRAAANLGKPIMSHEWVSYCWERRFDPNFVATREDVITNHKLKPFVGCYLSFVGFAEGEKKHMEEQAMANGARVVDCEDPMVTHLVVDEQNVRPENLTLKQPTNLVVVKGEWFWVSIQLDFCAHETLYLLTPPAHPGPAPECSLSQTPSSNSTASMAPYIAPSHSANENSGPATSSNTPFIIGNVRERSYSTSILDSSGDNSLLFQNGLVEGPVIVDMSVLDYNQCGSMRQMVSVEILNTERNYVTCLELIKNLYHKSLENMLNDPSREPLLDATEIKSIFGNLPPIHDVHKHMLVDLSAVLKSWSEENTSIGNVILAHVDGLLKVYPAFINFFHDSKNTLKLCDQNKPKFHAFLKVCEHKSESGRQNLEDLLIRPVQRLPSLILLLSDLLKHTPEVCEDRSALNEAINAVKSVLDQINEGKRKTETQLHMFEIVNDIENCPPNLLSSQRTFVFRANVHGLTNEPSVRGRHLALFLFNDCLEICKRRNTSSKLASSGSYLASLLNPVALPNAQNLVNNNASSSTLARSGSAPNPAALNYVKSNRALSADVTISNGREGTKQDDTTGQLDITPRPSALKDRINLPDGTHKLPLKPVQTAKSSNKSFKHVELLHLSHIKIIGDIIDNQEFTNAFAIICSHNYTREGRLLMFSVEDECLKKSFILEALHKNTVNTLCLSNGRTIMHAIHPNQINISSPIGGPNVNRTIFRAFRNAKKILTRKVSRAFSFSRTTPQKLKRAVSTMSSLTSTTLNEVLDMEDYKIADLTRPNNNSFNGYALGKVFLDLDENTSAKPDTLSIPSSYNLVPSPNQKGAMTPTSKLAIFSSPRSPINTDLGDLENCRNGITRYAFDNAKILEEDEVKLEPSPQSLCQKL